MTEDEIKAAINNALPLRPPKWNEPVAPSEKIAELEDYLMTTAYAQAELEEALHYIDALVAHFKAKVEDMTGYEALLPSSKRSERITKEDVLHAKRRTDPTTFEVGAEMRQLRTTAIRQIDRLRFEAQFVVSRCYTLISGS